MNISDSLKLIIPLKGDISGYHTPVSREVYEANFRALSATKAALFSKGKNYAGEVGPQIAALMFRDEAKRDAEDRGDVSPEGVPNDAGAVAFMGELRRLTLVLAPGANGWEHLPVDVAIARNLIDAEDWREAESGLVFFTCLYSICPRATRQKMALGIAGLLGAAVTSFSPMEYVDSLRTSTQAPDTKTEASSGPS